MGNVCSSQSSISTQTETARRKKPGLTPRLDIEDKPVHHKTWDDVFNHVIKTDLWEGVPRASRPEWKPLLTKIDELVGQPKKVPDGTKVRAVLQGRDSGTDLTLNNKILLYVCSTGTDTEMERTVLMKDVYPFVRDIGRQFDLEFEVIDLRWGRPNTDKYSDVQLHLQQLERFQSADGASIFLCFLSDDYGVRILPREIEEETLDTITAYMINNDIDTSLIKQYYILDKNSIRRKYVLKTEPDGNLQMSQTHKQCIVKLMKEAIPECFPCGEDMISRYFASLYEYELTTGLQSTGGKIFIRKRVEQTKEIDMTLDRKASLHNKTKDGYDLKQLNKLNAKVEETLKDSENSIFDLVYDDMDEMSTSETITNLTDRICEQLIKFIAKHRASSESIIMDRVLQDVLIHERYTREILHDVNERENEAESVRKYLEDDSIRTPLVIHGVKGVGKSAFMATVEKFVRLPHYVVVSRHIGITPESVHIKDLLGSICCQLERVYNKPVKNTCISYKDLVIRFRECLTFATEADPIVMFLNSLHNLSDENFAQNVRWLQLEQELPPYVKLVISTSPGQSLNCLRQVLNEDQFIEIEPILPLEVGGIVQKKLAEVGRQVTFDQTETLVAFYQKSPSLVISLGVKLAKGWHSYDRIDSENLSSDLMEMVESHLRVVEDKLGPVFVHHALGYLTAAKHGLSNNELVDLLSCDDEVLDTLPGIKAPTLRRFPSLYWIGLQHELSPYLTKMIYRGVTVITWCHREVTDMARGRYLVNSFREDKQPFEKEARTAIADYFEDKWKNGKVYSNISHSSTGDKFGRLETRYVASQQTSLCGDKSKSKKLNSRRLSELPNQLVHLHDWKRFKKVYKLDFVEAKFQDNLGFECSRDLTEAAILSGMKDIRYLTRLVASYSSVLYKEPSAVYQIASQYPTSSHIFKMLKASDGRNFPRHFVKNVSVVREDTSCEMTLLGHSAGVRSCDLSPDGDMIVSAADDGSLNIWYVITGMELAAMTSLPLPIETDDNDPLPTIPCCFSRSGHRIVVGTEDGNVLLMDNSGTLIKQENTDNDKITCLVYSRDDKTIVTSFRGGQLYFWDSDTLEHQSTIQLEDTITALDMSPDGNILAVACTRGLVLVDMVNLVMLSSSADTMTVGNLNQEVPDWFAVCCAFHPSGNEVLVGSSDHSISQWDVAEGQIRNKIVGHFGWVTSIKLNQSGDRMYSGSADRTIKAWLRGTTWTCIATLVGHSDVVTMIALDPTNGAYLVSSSLDCSLKVWNVEAIKVEEEVIEKDDGFEEGSDVMDQDGDHDEAEYVPFTNMVISHSTGSIAYSKGSERYSRIRRPGCPTVNTSVLNTVVDQIVFTADGSKLVILDTGRRKGDVATINNSYKTNVYVCNVDTGSVDHVIGGAEFGDDETPTSFSCGAWFIAVGTNKGDIHVYDDKAYEKLQQIVWHDVITIMVTCTVKNHLLAVSHKQAIILKISLDGYETVAYLPETESDYTRCAFSPVGNVLACGLQTGELHIWKITDSEIALIDTKCDHTSRIKDIAFSRSGDIMVTCADRSMRIWDMTNGVSLKCVYYSTIDRVVCIEEDVVLAGDFSGKLNTLTW